MATVRSPSRSLVVLALLTSVACSGPSSGAPDPSSPALVKAARAITPEGLLQHIQDLAADSMEGRGPGTLGGKEATTYLQQQFQALGLEPGNPDGTWFQEVDLIGYTSHPSATITARGSNVALAYPADYVADSRHDRREVEVDGSGIVFVGYGVEAPEYGWDDYKGVDVRGKTILMLVNDPPVRAADDTSQLDTTMFKGRAMTYYGRWTYKYEEASRRGAAAAIIIHETGPAGYPYSVVRGSWSVEQFDVPSAEAENRVAKPGSYSRPQEPTSTHCTRRRGPGISSP